MRKCIIEVFIDTLNAPKAKFSLSSNLSYGMRDISLHLKGFMLIYNFLQFQIEVNEVHLTVFSALSLKHFQYRMAHLN